MYLNSVKIGELGNEIGQDNVPMLLDIFVDELRGYALALNNDELLEEQRLVQMKEISHALKSSAASFGADHLCELANDIDYRVKTQVSLSFSVDGQALLDSMQKTRQAYLEYKDVMN